MAEKQTYAKSQLTQALLALLQSRRIHAVTVSELCRTAGVSRLSFYRNYDSMEDILKQYLHSITDAFLGSTSVNFRTTPKRAFIIHLARHMKQHRPIIAILLDNDLSYLLKEAFDEAFLRSADVHHDPYRCYAASGAYFNLMLYWFMNGCRETPEELAETDIRISGDESI